MARRVLPILLILVSALLLFWRLGGAPLWRDEGTTAVWARLMADSGSWTPWVYDFEKQQLLVQAEDGHDVNSKLLPAMQSYGQFYISAVSFRLLGAGEWSARLPYALIGALCLFLFWRLGLLLFGEGVPALIPPALAATSMFFLHAARQGRYYIVVVLAALLILYELARWCRDPDVLNQRSFLPRLGAWGLLLYFSNYVSFVGAWGALGLFALIQSDRAFLKRFLGLSAAMTLIVIPDFLALHSEFAGNWPPFEDRSLAEIYRGAIENRFKDIWRGLPLALFLPAGFWLIARTRRPSALEAALMTIGALTVLAPIALFSSSDVDAWSPLAFWSGVVACCSLPAAGWIAWSRSNPSEFGPRLALIAAILLLIGPMLTIAAGKSKANTRHFYQIFPAAIVLCSLAVNGFHKRHGTAAATALFAACALWPNLDLALGGTEQVVLRQYDNDRSYNGPLMDFMAANIQSGDKVAFLRSVKGMALYFYFPEMRWVEILNSEVPHNQQFRDKIPADQFDDCRCADWYIVWDPRGAVPKGLNDQDFEKVWAYSYPARLGWWDRNQQPSIREYEVYKRRN